MTITVTRQTIDPSVGLTLNYSTSNGSANAGSDYTGVTNGVISFAPFQLVQTFDIFITNDTDQESFETFNVTLSNAAPSRGLASSTT